MGRRCKLLGRISKKFQLGRPRRAGGTNESAKGIANVRNGSVGPRELEIKVPRPERNRHAEHAFNGTGRDGTGAIAPPDEFAVKVDPFGGRPVDVHFSTTGFLPGGNWNWPIQRWMLTSAPPELDEKVSFTRPCGVGIWKRASTKSGRRILDLVPSGRDAESNSVETFSNGPF